VGGEGDGKAGIRERGEGINEQRRCKFLFLSISHTQQQHTPRSAILRNTESFHLSCLFLFPCLPNRKVAREGILELRGVRTTTRGGQQHLERMDGLTEGVKRVMRLKRGEERRGRTSAVLAEEGGREVTGSERGASVNRREGGREGRSRCDPLQRKSRRKGLKGGMPTHRKPLLG
jgi:hypothetical protein